MILLEVYVIPGFNVVGILGFLLIVFAVGYFFVEQGPLGGAVALAGSLVFGIFFFWALWRSGAWERFVLSANLSSSSESAARAQAERKHFLGCTGRAITPLRPIGTAEFEGRRIEVTTEGEYIASGSEVCVVAKLRRYYVVRLATDLHQSQFPGGVAA